MRLHPTAAPKALPGFVGASRMSAALLLLAALLFGACAAPHEEALGEAARTPAPMPGASASALASTPTLSLNIVLPSSVSTPKPLPTLAPASSPDELYAVSFMTDRAVFAVFGLWGAKAGVKFFDLESSPFVPEDAANGLEDGLMVHAAQVLLALGYEVVTESNPGLVVRTDEEGTLKFTAGSAEYFVNGAKKTPPKGVPAALWREDCLWVSTRVLPLPAVIGVGEEKGMLTFDARGDDDASGRAAAADAGLEIWGVYPK